MHRPHREAGAAQARPRPPGRDAPGAGARPVEAGLRRSQARSRPGAHRAAQADRRVRRRASRWSRRWATSRIVVELAGIDDPARAKAIVQRSAFLEFRITDETNALEKALPAMDRALRGLGIRGENAGGPPLGGGAAAGRRYRGEAAPRERRQGGPGQAAAPTAPQDSGEGQRGRRHRRRGRRRPHRADPGLRRRRRRRRPGEYMVPETAFPRVDSLLNIPAVARQLPRGIALRWSRPPTSVGVESYRFLYALDDRPIITGSNLVDAQAQIDPLTNGPIVTFQLDRAGGRKFGEETGRHVGDYMAILLDGRVQGRPPVIQSRIGRNGQITLVRQDAPGGAGPGAHAEGRRAADSAQDRRGAAGRRQPGQRLHPVGHHRRRHRHVFVVLVMVLYYRVAGVLAVAALALYLLFTLGGLVDARRHPDAAGSRGPGALDRHRGGRQRADLRANPGGAGGAGRPCGWPWTRASGTR